jgi:hydrogenase maturation factor
VAVRGVVVKVGERDALVDVGGVRERVAIDLVPEVTVGDALLCHAGVALEKLAVAKSP